MFRVYENVYKAYSGFQGYRGLGGLGFRRMSIRVIQGQQL